LFIRVYFAFEDVVLHGARGHLVQLFLFLVERVPDQILSTNGGEIIAVDLARGILALLLDRRGDFVDLALDLFYAGIVRIKGCG